MTPSPPTPLADPGTLLATTHAVDGGLRVRLRLARPSDADGVRAFLDGLSPESRRLRFLHAMPAVPDSIVRHFTFYDPRRRLVVAATAMDGRREEIVGLADVALLETGLAELGVVVDDERRDRGVGKLLTEVIASLAMRQGATQLKAELLERNAAMQRLMERIGPTVRSVEGGSSVIYTRLPGVRRRRAA